MSKECECCHTWWYDSDVKENLCPNCYDYFKQLKQQLEEKEKELAYMTKQAKKFNNEAQKYYEDAYCNSFQNQKAIAELEKVKEEMDLNGNSYCEIRQGTSPHNPTDYAWFNYVKFRNYLNQQIKELKENDMEINKDLGFGIIETTKEPSYRQGWICPKCGGVMAPDQSYCVFCQSNNIRDIEVTYTGIMPLISTKNKSISKGE